MTHSQTRAWEPEELAGIKTILSQVRAPLFVPDIFALEHTNGIEKITRYFDFYR